jgi:hypothetical protein
MTELQRAVREIEVATEHLQRPALARCRTQEQVHECIGAYAFLAQTQIDAVSQMHGMTPMLWRAK